MFAQLLVCFLSSLVVGVGADLLGLLICDTRQMRQRLNLVFTVIFTASVGYVCGLGIASGALVGFVAFLATYILFGRS